MVPSTATRPAAPDSADEVNDYLRNMPYDVDDSIQWWLEQSCSAKSLRLPALALNILAAPSSEAYAERIFSVAGDLTIGRRNRLLQSLERKVFLKLNKSFIPA